MADFSNREGPNLASPRCSRGRKNIYGRYALLAFSRIYCHSLSC